MIQCRRLLIGYSWPQLRGDTRPNVLWDSQCHNSTSSQVPRNHMVVTMQIAIKSQPLPQLLRPTFTNRYQSLSCRLLQARPTLNAKETSYLDWETKTICLHDDSRLAWNYLSLLTSPAICMVCSQRLSSLKSWFLHCLRCVFSGRKCIVKFFVDSNWSSPWIRSLISLLVCWPGMAMRGKFLV